MKKETPSLPKLKPQATPKDIHSQSKMTTCHPLSGGPNCGGSGGRRAPQKKHRHPAPLTTVKKTENPCALWMARPHQTGCENL